MKTFEHKKDVTSMFGLVGIIIIVNLLRFVNGYGFSIPVLALTLLLTIMVVWMWAVSSYTVENEQLTVKNGPFSQKVDVKEIEKIKNGSPSIFKGKLSTYELTLIDKKNKKLKVFPIDKESFIKTLLKINPTIKVD